MNTTPSTMNSDSSPATRTKLPAVSLGNTAESNSAQTARTNPAQIHPSEAAADDDDRGGKFPMEIRFRHITVKVYRKTQKYPFYRIA